MEIETPQEYIENFESKVDEYINEYFGTRQEFIKNEIEFLYQEKEYIKHLSGNEEFQYIHLEKEANEIGYDKFMNLRQRKIEFLESQLGHVNIEQFEGQMKFETQTDLVELAQALVANKNWTGHRKDLVTILTFLSKSKEINDKKIVEKIKARINGHTLIPQLHNALEDWAGK